MQILRVFLMDIARNLAQSLGVAVASRHRITGVTGVAPVPAYAITLSNRVDAHISENRRKKSIATATCTSRSKRFRRCYQKAIGAV